MKFEASYEIERIISKDLTRPSVICANLEVDRKPGHEASEKKGRLAAMNGHALAVIPVEVDGDTAGAVPAEAIKLARKAAGKHGQAILACGKEVSLAIPGGTQTFRRDTTPFPNFAQLIPVRNRGDKDTFTVAFDAKLLLELAKAIGTEKVILAFSTRDADHDPILVRPLAPNAEAFGVLMPCGLGR